MIDFIDSEVQCGFGEKHIDLGKPFEHSIPKCFQMRN
jgi:hypothetical protein